MNQQLHRIAPKSLYGIFLLSFLLMSHTCRGPSSRVIADPDDRFEVLEDFSDLAVLDNATNLVWTRNIPVTDFQRSWQSAVNLCNTYQTGYQFGWRLPTIQELSSLFTPALDGDRTSIRAKESFLADEERFFRTRRFGQFDPPLEFWSITTSPYSTARAYYFRWANGSATADTPNVMGEDEKSVRRYCICVRGGSGLDPLPDLSVAADGEEGLGG